MAGQRLLKLAFLMTWPTVAALFAILVISPLELSAAISQTATSNRKPAAAPAKRASTAHSTASTKHSRANVRTHSARRHSGRRAAPGPSYQLHPDPQRYQEIQKALADKGYFKGEVNGVWGADSVDALQRFQADRKLPNDGKISALSLIALGLGPKHDSVASEPAAPSSGTAQSPTAPKDSSKPAPALIAPGSRP